MPTIAEDNISQRSSQFSGDDANFEQLMVSMLDERDKLMDSLREAQERLNDAEVKLTDTEKERDTLQRQINANLPQVRRTGRPYVGFPFLFSFASFDCICCAHFSLQMGPRSLGSFGEREFARHPTKSY